ncbi:7696_t:CDS:1, partial [Dentiscutata erythropus]
NGDMTEKNISLRVWGLIEILPTIHQATVVQIQKAQQQNF